MLHTLVIIVLVLIGAGLMYLTTLDGSYRVKRTCLVNEGIDTTFNKIRDFRSWPDWSPWILHEPETRLKYSDHCDEEGGYYTWDGQRTGAGRLTHVSFSTPTRIDQSLEFTRPFKSVCQVGFDFEDQDGQTLITWSMSGNMPFLLRPMASRTAEMVGRDYELGLAMLAGKLDPLADHPELTFEGETTLPVQRAACCFFSGGIEALKSAMETSFPLLLENFQKKETNPGAPFTAYHKVHLERMEFNCDLAVPVTRAVPQSEQYEIKTFSGGRYFKTILKGDYRFLGLAWHSATAHLRMLKLKKDKRRPSLEIYNNDPRAVTSGNDLVTSLYIPIK